MMRRLLISAVVMLAGCTHGGDVPAGPAPASGGPDDGPPPAAGEAEPGSGAEAEADGGVDAKPNPEVERIRAALAAQRITLDFEDAPFGTVMKYIAMQSGVNIVIDARVLARLTDGDTRVNLQVDDSPVQSALDILLEFTSLTSQFKHGVLYITDYAGSQVGDPVPAPDSEAAKAMEATLDRMRVSPSFNSTPLQSVLQFFGDVSGVSMLISPKVFELTPEDSLRVTLEVDNVSMRDALALILTMTNLTYRVQDGVLIVEPHTRD